MAFLRFKDFFIKQILLIAILSSFAGVKLTAFDVSLVDKKVVVSWSTSVEKDASHFVVQRSTDGVEFTDAGIIFTEGNYSEKRSYSFKDPISTAGKKVLYYRLKMVDLDGRYELSQIKQVNLVPTLQ